MSREERENREAAERLIPGTMKIVAEGMTTSEHADAANIANWKLPTKEQAALIEKGVAESALGRELMQPMPPGWGRSMHEITRPRGSVWEVVMTHKDQWRMPDDKKADYTAYMTKAELTEAHRLCREQAWAKHRKNTGEE